MDTLLLLVGMLLGVALTIAAQRVAAWLSDLRDEYDPY